MKKLIVHTLAATVILAGLATAASAIPNRPAGARKFAAEFVKAYRDCTVPNDATLNPFLSLAACSPAVESDPSCGFDPNGKGKVKIIADIPAGDLRYKVKFKRLTASCAGETLDFIIKYQQTNDDCSGGHCTAVPTELVAGSCVVTGSGTCSITSTVNTGAGGAVLAPGLETSLELHGCGMKHNGELVFTCGLLLD